ncbi:MAG TPA: phospholipase D-like domain-containing protein [Candidatus Saccharimonadales bacterium]|nr:phospholipase D-like domain-containing protein [Candidatus Saccharimonadales bacterium]
MFRFLCKDRAETNELLASTLHDQDTFYPKFIQDLNTAQSEVIIESPFITGNRVASLLPIFSKIRSRDVRVIVNTRDPHEHDFPFSQVATDAIQEMQALGVEVLFTGGHHRKLAIIDGVLLWEGSLNILSQNDSCEIMRRTNSPSLAQQVLRFTKINAFLG